MSSTCGDDLLDLARLQLADEVPAELGVLRRLGLEVLRAVLAQQRQPGLAEHAELLQRHVLDRGQQLDLGRVAAGVGDRRAHALEVGVDARGVEAGDQARHMTPAWRPVMPLSRRCEKKRSSQIVHRPTSMNSMPWASSCWRAPPRRCRGCAPRGARRRPRSARGPPRRPRSSSRARWGRARRRPDRGRRPRAAPAGPPRRSRPPAAASRSAARRRRPRRRAGPAGSRRRRRSRRRRSARSPGRPPACRAARPTAARSRAGRSPRGPGARNRSAATDGRRTRPAGAGSRPRSPARRRSAGRGSATRTGRSTRRRARTRRPPAHAAGRRRSGRSPSGTPRPRGYAPCNLKPHLDRLAV